MKEDEVNVLEEEMKEEESAAASLACALAATFEQIAAQQEYFRDVTGMPTHQFERVQKSLEKLNSPYSLKIGEVRSTKHVAAAFNDAADVLMETVIQVCKKETNSDGTVSEKLVGTFELNLIEVCRMF